MKCKECGGRGIVYLDTRYWAKCQTCRGTGKMPLTNEEWFCSLSTDEKAAWLDKVAENCCQICDESDKAACRANTSTGCKFENSKSWKKWLEEPHK